MPGLGIISIVWALSNKRGSAFYSLKNYFLVLIVYLGSNPSLLYALFRVIYFTSCLCTSLIDFFIVDLIYDSHLFSSSGGNPLPPTGGGYGNPLPPTGGGNGNPLPSGGNGNQPPAGGQPNFPTPGILHDLEVNPVLNQKLIGIHGKLSQLLNVVGNTNPNAGLTMNSAELTGLTFTPEDRAIMKEQIMTVHPDKAFRFTEVRERGFSFTSKMSREILGLFKPR